MNLHKPVLLNETLEYLAPKEGDSYLDLTAGYGGHAVKVISKTKAPSLSVLVDRDQFAIQHLEGLPGVKDARIVKSDFMSAARNLGLENQHFDMILADLGVSSPHLNMASRGFSILHEGPLDMRMDQTAEVTAADIVNKLGQAELANMIYEYGEEKQSRRIAEAIVKARPVSTTSQLARIIESAIGWRSKGHHPATKTFQAIRISVNKELDQLENVLPQCLKLLKPNGRLVVITFHSLEDRIVKRQFQEACSGGYDAEFQLLTKKPVEPTHQEIVNNPRARSAKLRALVKIKTERAD